MKRLIGWSVLFIMLAGLTVLPWLMLDDAPAIEPPGEFRRNDLAWIKTLFQKYDPRRQTPDVIQSIQLDEAEINRLLNYAVELRRVSGIAADLTLGLASVTATMAVPPNPFGRYLNLTAEVADMPGGIRIQGLQLGSLPLFARRAAMAFSMRVSTSCAEAGSGARVSIFLRLSAPLCNRVAR